MVISEFFPRSVFPALNISLSHAKSPINFIPIKIGYKFMWAYTVYRSKLEPKSQA